jgi:glycosyltransferase involved in cell wall biosynthesis
MNESVNIGVVMTVLNGENYIQDAIKSLIDQSYQNWNLFIVENASKDGTKDVIQKFNTEERIKTDFLKETLPRTQALNYGFKMLPTKIDYIMVLDADDLIEPGWLDSAVKFLDLNDSVGVLGGYAHIINQNGKELETLCAPSHPLLINEVFSYTFPVAHSSLFFRKNVVDGVDGPYDTRIKIGQDWDLCIKLAQVTEICVIDRFSVRWRRYAESVTGDSDNFLESRLDKLSNLRNGRKCIRTIDAYLRNRSRQGIENLAISLIFYQKKMYLKCIKGLLISIYQNPFAILLNNKVLKRLSISKTFFKSS